MEYDLNGNRVFGAVADSFGNVIEVKEGSSEHALSAGKAQIRLHSNAVREALYVYPTRAAVQDLVDILTAFLAATDGKGDLPEPDAPDGPAR